MNRSTIKTTLSLPIALLSVLVPFLAPHSAAAAERSLAGVKIFSPIGIVLNKYGDPTFLTSASTVAAISFTDGEPTLTPPGGSSITASFATTDTAQLPSSTGSQQYNIDALYDNGSRYYYDNPKKGLIYEFVSTNAGRVVEIKLIGYHSTFKTSLGIGLGSNYEQIVLKYGYPEDTINQVTSNGDELTLNYTQRDHVAFKLVRNKVAVISVVAPD